jgi:hypothetical protein
LNEYLYYERPSGEAVIASPEGLPIESQLLRRVFAVPLGIADLWNWREEPRVPEVIETECRLRRVAAELDGLFERAMFSEVAVDAEPADSSSAQPQAILAGTTACPPTLRGLSLLARGRRCAASFVP